MSNFFEGKLASFKLENLDLITSTLFTEEDRQWQNGDTHLVDFLNKIRDQFDADRIRETFNIKEQVLLKQQIARARFLADGINNKALHQDLIAEINRAWALCTDFPDAMGDYLSLDSVNDKEEAEKWFVHNIAKASGLQLVNHSFDKSWWKKTKSLQFYGRSKNPIQFIEAKVGKKECFIEKDSPFKMNELSDFVHDAVSFYAVHSAKSVDRFFEENSAELKKLLPILDKAEKAALVKKMPTLRVKLPKIEGEEAEVKAFYQSLFVKFARKGFFPVLNEETTPPEMVIDAYKAFADDPGQILKYCVESRNQGKAMVGDGGDEGHLFKDAEGHIAEGDFSAPAA